MHPSLRDRRVAGAAAVLALAVAGMPASFAQDAQRDEQTRRYQHLAEELIEEGRYDEAAQLLQKAAITADLERGKRLLLSQWHVQQGQEALDGGQPMEALVHAQQALVLDPKNRTAKQLRLQAQQDVTGNQRQIAAKLQLEIQARAAERSGNAKQAMQLWKQAQAMDAHDPQIQQAIDALEARLRPETPRIRRAAEINLIPYKPFIDEYIISRGDVIEVFVWQQPDLTRDVVVRPDGRISFPLVGDVDAAGLTLSRLDDIITERLRTYVRLPDVSLAIRRFGGTKTIVLGEVDKPGIYIPAEEGRVLDVIAMAGGFKEHAHKEDVMLIRGGTAEPQVAKLDLAKALSLGVMEENVRLQPNDIVYVPEKRVNSVLDFLDDFYPVIDQILVGQSIATGFGTDVRINKSDRPVGRRSR